MKKNIFSILTVGWSLAILFLTLSPDTGEEPYWLLDIQGMDKVAHFGLFFILAVVSFEAADKMKINISPLITVILYGVVLAASTEYGQMYVEGRSSDVWDFAADMAGVIVGVFLAKK